MKAVNLLINSFLPEDLQSEDAQYTKKGLNALLSEIAQRYPERYSEILKNIGDTGRLHSYTQGETLGLDDMRPVFDKDLVIATMKRRIERTNRIQDPNARKEARMKIFNETTELLHKLTMEHSAKAKTNLSNSVLSGARGNPIQLRSMITSPGLYTDYKGEPIDVFVENSFGEGLRPAAYLASTFGTRKSVISTKSSTADAGFLSKQMGIAAADMVVSEEDSGSQNGIKISTEDINDVRGRVLAKQLGPYPAGTVVDKDVISYMKDKNTPFVYAKSPLTSATADGVDAESIGVMPNGQRPGVGMPLGQLASTSLGEPVCLGGDTMIRLAQGGKKRIKDMRVGDMVLGSDLEGNLKPTRVVNVFHNGPRECVATTVRKAKANTKQTVQLISTKEHKVLSAQANHRADRNFTPKIQPIECKKKYTKVYMPLSYDDTQHIEEPMAFLLGCLIGDGSYTGGITSGGIGFSCYDAILADTVDRDLAQCRCRLRHCEKGEYRVSLADQHAERKGKKVGSWFHPIKLKLQAEGMWGQSSKIKTLPRSIWTWDNKSVVALIAGLIDTDGWVSEKNKLVGFGSGSLKLVEDVKLLLETRFGVYTAGICIKRKKKDDGTYYDPIYEIQVSDNASLLELHKHMKLGGIKQPRFDAVVKKCKTTYNNRNRFSVISQEPVGVIDTWDIEVDNETHLFVLANGLIVSNTQMGLNAKHTAGAATGKGKQTYGGFHILNQFMQTPKQFPHKATVSEHLGKVEDIHEAPQGGYYITINGEQHYTLPGMELKVKQGDSVEPGDALSDGLVDPKDIVRLRGLGEGRKYYVERLKQIYKDSGVPVSRINLEILARGALNHIVLDDNTDYPDLPMDEPVRYNQFARRYKPSKDARSYATKDALGKYLESPVLHYTIGTQLTPRMLDEIAEAGHSNVVASANTPNFKSTMVRIMGATDANPDWFARLNSTHLKKQLQRAAVGGEDTNIESNIHFAPRIAVGGGFGDKLTEKGKF